MLAKNRSLKKKRGITRFAITESIYAVVAAKLPRGTPERPGMVWVGLDELALITLSGPHRRWVTELLAAAK